MTGEKFARSLLSPVPLDAVWSVVQGGVPADFLLGLTVQSMGGHYNLGLYGGEIQKMDPEFARMLQVMRSLQEAHAFDPEIISNSERAETWMRFPAPGSFTPSLVEQAAELKVLLNIPAGTERVRVTYGTRNAEPGVVAVRTRSLMQIISTLGAGVQIPVEHATAGEVLRLEAADLPFTSKCIAARTSPNADLLPCPTRDTGTGSSRTILPPSGRLLLLPF